VQIELDSGKRVKVKAANVLLRFDKPAPAELMAPPTALAAEIDLDLAWEFAPEDEFGFADLARDYFDAKAGPEQAGRGAVPPVRGAALLPPRRQGPFKKAPEETSRPRCWASSARSSRPRRSRPGPASWWGPVPGAGARAALPHPVQARQERPEYKAVVEAARRAQRAPLDLLQAAGAIDSPYQFHWRRFLFDSSPRAPASRRAGGAGHQGRPAAGRRAGLLDRRLGHHRDRRRAVGAGPGHRHGGVRRAHRRAGPGHRARSPRWTRWRASACPPSTCRAGS
jgi:hypothetical protein